METEILNAKPGIGCIYRTSITHAAKLLRAGELVAFPTDTVYGVAAVISKPAAVAQLYVAKRRPPGKAIPILIADANDLNTIVTEINELVRRLIARFWPGRLTLILPKSSRVPAEVSQTPNVAVRLPDLTLAREIIAAAGTPLAVTSANRSGEPSSRTAREVLAQLGDRVAAVVDGGTCPGGMPSTILDCTANPPRIVRAGAIPAKTVLSFAAISQQPPTW